MNPLQKVLEYPHRERYTDGTFMTWEDRKLFAQVSVTVIVLGILVLLALVTLI